MKIGKILFSLFSTVACLNAAQASPLPPPELYLGVQGGYADTNFGNSTMIARPAYGSVNIHSANIDNHVFGVRGYGGYQWNEYIGTEVGYLRVRSTRYTNINQGSVPNGDISEYALDFRGKLYIPMAAYIHLSPYLQLGLAYLDATSHGGITRNGSGDFGYSIHPVIGAGIGYNFSPNITGDFSWASITKRNSNVPRIDMYFLGVTYRFSLQDNANGAHNYGDPNNPDP